jgi:anti-sigma factor RsiW
MSANDDQARGASSAVSEGDLRAYVAGALNPARRREVEGFLACNPDLAARVMTELHLRGAPAPTEPRQRPRPRLLAVAGVVACLGSAVVGWNMAAPRDLNGWRELDGDMPPDYVEDAAESRQATQVREVMVSQIESPNLDAAEVKRTMRLQLPRLPQSWRIVDAQVYPTDDGPSVNLVVEGPDRRRMNLFAVRVATLANVKPELATRGEEAVAFWKIGNSAYVLSGDGSRQELLAEATTLSRSASL